MKTILDILVVTDPQEIFDRVVERLAAQGVPCIDRSGECVYFAAGGYRCAVGHVLKNEVLRPEMATAGSLHSLMKRLNVPATRGVLDSATALDSASPPVTTAERAEDLLVRLQLAHDVNDCRADLVDTLRSIAQRCGLSAASVDKHMPFEWVEKGDWI